MREVAAALNGKLLYNRNCSTCVFDARDLIVDWRHRHERPEGLPIPL